VRSSMGYIWISSAPSIRKIYFPLFAVGRDNVALTEYLIGQVLESPEERFAALREFFPKAKQDDWRVEVADQHTAAS
jgi:L-2-hydroxyglutarate oxidase LhgO